MNWRFILPFAIVAVAVLAVAGVATVNMGDKQMATENQQVATQKGQDAVTAPTQGSAMMAKTNTAAVVSTGDPVADVVGTVDTEGNGDSAMMTSAAADASVVRNDSADLSALSSSYDATTF